MLKALDRPEAFLQQAAAAPPVRRAYPASMEEAATSSSAGESANPDVVRTMVQEMVQEIVPWQENQDQDEEEYESNEDSVSEGQLIVDFEDDAEYSESEALKILADHAGRAQVRRDR